MDPYEARPEGIPPRDLYKDLPLYGRYCPQPEDFVPEPKYCNSTTPEALHYWSTVLQKCDSRCYVYENPFGGRDVFALGSVIIKSRHLQLNRGDLGSESSRDYSITDANEIAAIQLASRVVTTPEIFFKGRIGKNDIMVQSRIPGVGLNVAWPYLSQDQKASFKGQVRDIISRIATVSRAASVVSPSYIFEDSDPVKNRDITPEENELLFQRSNTTPQPAEELSFSHNDLQTSNIIVDSDKIVGIIDWEHAGWFRKGDVAAVHKEFREPRKQDFAQANLSEAKIADLLYWSDIYEF